MSDVVPVGRIVVGIDGSEGSTAALEWAAAKARRLGAALEVVLCWELRAPYLAPHPPHEVFVEETRERAESTLAAQVADVDLPDGAACEAVEGPPASTLLARAEEADLLVVGAHGSDGFMPGIGSIATRCAIRNTVPTVVVPSGGAAVPDGPALVGVDGSTAGTGALLAALALAAPGRELIAVHAWTVPAVTGPAISVLDPSLFEAEGQEALDATLAVLADADRPRVTERLVHGSARVVLRDLAEESSMVVVGVRGHSTLLHRMMGSVATYLLHHHPTAVVVVPVEVVED
ncbi:MAG: universal stress protein [Actinomycetota bacterium]